MITVTLPWPDKRLSPNARLDRRQVAPLKALARQAAKILTREASPEEPTFICDIPLELEFCPPDARRRDRDNMLSSCKAALDGIADALGIDDAHFEPITLRQGEVTPGGAVIVRIGKE